MKLKQDIRKTIPNGHLESLSKHLIDFVEVYKYARNVNSRVIHDNSDFSEKVIDLDWTNMSYAPGTPVKIRFYKNGDNNLQILVSHAKLESKLEAMDIKHYWAEILNLLKEYVHCNTTVSFSKWIRRHKDYIETDS